MSDSDEIVTTRIIKSSVAQTFDNNGVILERLSGRKLFILVFIFISMQLGFFFIGGFLCKQIVSIKL
jgi:hypothetical protein